MRGNLNPLIYLDGACARDPGAPCLVDGVSGEVLDYAEVRHRTMQVAATLRAHPEVRRVGLLAPNDITAFIVQLGCFRAGVPTVAGNIRYAVADNAAIFSRLGADLIFLHPALGPAADALASALPASVTLVSLGEAPLGSAVPLTSWLSPAAWEGAAIRDPDALYAIQPTGGTTGLPKGVLMPVRELAFAVDSFMLLAPPDGVPVFLAAVPLTHAAGKFAHYIFEQGGSVVVMPGAEPPAVLSALERWRVTHTFLPPTVIYGLIDSGLVPAHDLSSLRYLFYGAAPMSPARLAAAITQFGPVLAQVYGQTESGLPNCYLAPRDHLGPDGQPADVARLSSAGRINPLCELALLGDEGAPVAPDQVGEIAIRGDGVMLGYDGDPAASAATRRDGWHLTGDLARIDADGFVHIVDRAKDLIISGGFNIYPAEVERAVNSHPAVAECAVVGLPDARWGEAVTAVIELRPGSKVEPAELIDMCKGMIGSLKAPKQVLVVDSLPRSPVGKILKRELRQRFWDEQERLV